MTQSLNEHVVNLLKYAREVIWCVNADSYDLLYTNDACYDLWGYTAQEMTDDKNIFFSHIHPDDVEICMNGFASARLHGRSHNEFRIIHKTGTVKIIKGDAIFVKGENGFPDTFTGITLDVTEERALQEKIMVSERRFHAIADHSPVMIWASDEKNGVVYVNKAWIEFTGKDSTSIYGASWMQLLHPDDADRIKNARETIYNDLKIFEIECRLLSKEGDYRNVIMRGTPQHDSLGNFTGFIGTGFDITEMRLLNEQLLDSELKFKSIANDSPILMWTADTFKKCTFFNDTWTRFSGRKTEELMNDRWTELIHPDDKPVLTAVRDEHYKNRTSFELECRLLNRHNDYRWIQIKGSPQFNSRNEFVGFVGNGIDITSLKNYNTKIRRVNSELRLALEESNRLMQLINKTKNIVVLADREGRITWTNNAFEKITGYTLEEAIGKKPGQLVQGPDTDPATVALLRNGTMNGEVVKAEILNYSKDGRKYWLDIRIEPVYNENDELTGFLAIEIDITQRKQDEKILAENNKRLRQFSFITSHELRHEFSKIMMLLNASKMSDVDTDELRSYFNELEVPVNKINVIIQQMNEYLLADSVIEYVKRNNVTIDNIEEICLIDDDKLINMMHQRMIKRVLPDIQIKVFENINDAFEYINIQPSLNRLILLDLNFPDKTGWDFLDRYNELDMWQPVVILSSSIDNTDRKKAGTYKQVADFLTKPLTVEMFKGIFQ